jgi:hypothetical protein
MDELSDEASLVGVADVGFFSNGFALGGLGVILHPQGEGLVQHELGFVHEVKCCF